ncbi:hypothetical protein [Methanolobus sp. ZRKC5]|uniref:hypothetical protein n=1 Tax=Methanolobus sp. ZRKC5 TaxID=3136295 RepID=UPI00313EAC39
MREKGAGSIPQGAIPNRWIKRVKKGIEDPIITIIICLRKKGRVPCSIPKRKLKLIMIQRIVYEKCTQYHIPGS